MKLWVKISVSLATLILVMVILPLVIIKLFPSWAGIGLWLICFFAVNPSLIIGLGIVAGLDVRKLWWLPIISALLFPVLFGAVINDWVWDLYVYSAIYLVIGIVTMLATYCFNIFIIKKQDVKDCEIFEQNDEA